MNEDTAMLQTAIVADLPRCGVCGNVMPPPSAKGGRPRTHCSRECTLLDHHLGAVETFIMQKGETMRPEVHAALRSRLWLLGNQLKARVGRQKGTFYWHLQLKCGHAVDYKARTHTVDGKSQLDAAPKTTKCPECAAKVEVAVPRLCQAR